MCTASTNEVNPNILNDPKDSAIIMDCFHNYHERLWLYFSWFSLPYNKPLTHPAHSSHTEENSPTIVLV